jgi:hypothetical protein
MVRLVTTLALCGLLLWACSSSATGVNACKSIEAARCQRLPSCPSLSMSPPIWTSGSGVDACIRYYDTACLHGLDVADPGATAVAQCVKAIANDGCDVVATPEIDPACAWLVPLALVEEAGAADAAAPGDADAAAADGETE